MFLRHNFSVCLSTWICASIRFVHQTFSDCVHKMPMNTSANVMNIRASNRHTYTNDHSYEVNEWQWCQWKEEQSSFETLSVLLFTFMHKCFIYLRVDCHTHTHPLYSTFISIQTCAFFSFSYFCFYLKRLLFVWSQLVFKCCFLLFVRDNYLPKYLSDINFIYRLCFVIFKTRHMQTYAENVCESIGEENCMQQSLNLSSSRLVTMLHAKLIVTSCTSYDVRLSKPDNFITDLLLWFERIDMVRFKWISSNKYRSFKANGIFKWTQNVIHIFAFSKSMRHSMTISIVICELVVVLGVNALQTHFFPLFIRQMNRCDHLLKWQISFDKLLIWSKTSAA